MNSQNKLVNKLSRDVKKLENKIEHRILYSIRNMIVNPMLKSGIVIDYAFPYILSSIMLMYCFSAKGNMPFRIDKITQKASIETIDTSSGIHLEHVSYDFEYDRELLEYSTGWIINERGLYERVVTSYRISDEINLSETDKILSMSKEEIENLLVITNIQTICKNALTPEDRIYDSDAIIIINHSKSEEKAIARNETSSENTWNSIWFIICSLPLGEFNKKIERLFVKTYIRDKLREYEPQFRQINKKELETIKKILEVKKQNLAMLNEGINNIVDSKNYPFQLRKDIGEDRTTEERPYMLERI